LIWYVYISGMTKMTNFICIIYNIAANEDLRFNFPVIMIYYSTFQFVSLHVSNSSTILIRNVSRDDNASWANMAQWKLLMLLVKLRNRMITMVVYTRLFLMSGFLLYKLAIIRPYDREVKISHLTTSLGKSIEKKE
jgi:hypothetical protein